MGWGLFLAGFFLLLILDLRVFHRTARVLHLKEAALWVSFWVGLSVLFGAGIGWLAGPEPALQFFTGYLIELALSVDNLFVFVLIFAALAVPAQYQHRVLFYGIVSAILLRGLMILGGAWLIHHFHWILYIFGAFLVVSGLRLAWQREEKEVQVENSLALRLVRRVAPVVPRYHGAQFLAWENGRRVATPLLVVLVLIELTDLLFALDSIPAVFAVTQDPFLVFTSNMLAILGLRALYFMLAGLVARLVYLRPGLAVVLSFIGMKMLLQDLYPVPTWLSLVAVAAILGGSIVASLLWGRPAVPGPLEESPAPTADQASSFLEGRSGTP
jgi:tellurite resistance protein TerC